MASYTIRKSGTGSGSISVTKSGVQVTSANAGESLIIKATPATGWQLTSFWFDNRMISGSSAGVVMPAHNVEVRAVFSRRKYIIGKVITGNGNVFVRENGEEISSAYYSEMIDITAEAEKGWYLQELQFNRTTISSGQTVSMPALDTFVSAVFRQTEHPISIEHGTGGSVKALVNGEEASTAHYGDRITLEADADAGYILDSLTFNGAPVKAGQAYSMPNGNVTVKAAFRNIPYADIQMGIQDVFPAYMLRDRNGLAMASAIFTAMKKTVTDLGNAFHAMYDPDKMPEWRLDEAAQEMGMRWYDNTASVENKRDLIRNAWNFARIIGTPKAVEDVMSALFGKTVVEEEAEAFHYSLKTSYDTGSTAALRRFYRLLEGCANLRSTLDGIEFDGGAVVTEGAVYSAAMIHGEEIGSWAVAE